VDTAATRPGGADTALVARMLVVDLVPVLGIVYLTEIRSRARQGRRVGVKRGSSERNAAPSYQLISVVTTLSVIALIVAPNGRLATQRGITNCVSVLLVCCWSRLSGCSCTTGPAPAGERWAAASPAGRARRRRPRRPGRDGGGCAPVA